jgi:hypothetical protein
MPVVEIPVTERKLAARLVAMHTWLHKKKCDPLRFETQADPAGITLVRVEFDRGGLAESFRRTFDEMWRRRAWYVSDGATKEAEIIEPPPSEGR